ncbi:Protein SDA1 [Coelomomyces lativittatus]|nr:Protein SDA1 [Coelomomyces lativittatus]KAJ1511814.1 Protein SDA1 [Coelomomyces lativittatus]KAJ1517536.1 Protein SDA1 [Coelomomyces lativittatus]
MGRQRNRHDDLILNLPNLQNLIKRDPDSYVHEFQQQLRHSEMWLTVSSNVKDSPKKQLLESLNFIAHTLPCYPTLEAYHTVPSTWIQCLTQSANEMHPELRLALVTGLLLLCQKYLTYPTKKKGTPSSNKSLTSKCAFDLHQVHVLCFQLLACKDKPLRVKVLDFLVRSLTLSPCSKSKLFQQTIFQHLQSQPLTSLSVRALQVCILLFRKKIWYTKIMANQIAQCCFSKNLKMQTMAIQFLVSTSQSSLKKRNSNFGGSSKDEENHDDENEDEDDHEEDEDSNHEENQNRSMYALFRGTTSSKQRLQLTQRHLNRAEFVSKITKKSKKNQRRLERTKKKILQSSSQRSSKTKSSLSSSHAKYTPIEWLFDPHVFSETLLKQLKACHGKLEFKLLHIQLLSMCIALHQLLLPGFYTFLQKYLQPHQSEVTKFLAYTAQAVHAWVPPDWISMVVRKIADQFIGDQCAEEVMTVGLHSIREIVQRMPLALDSDLLSDLILYQSHREKSVAMAAKGLVSVFREVCPSSLPKKMRGKECTLGLKKGWIQDFQYGVNPIKTRVDGIELLEQEVQLAKEINTKSSHAQVSSAELEDRKSDLRNDLEYTSDVDNEEDEGVNDDDDDDDDEVEEDGKSCMSSDQEYALDLDNEDDEESEEDGSEEDVDENSEVDPSLSISESGSPKDSTASDPLRPQNEINPLESDASLTSSALPLEATKILTEEDYAQIAELKQKWKSTHKRPYSTHSVMTSSNRIDPDDLLQSQKKTKLDKASRLTAIAEQKKLEGKRHCGPRFMKSEHMSKTKKELAKTKNFKMISKSRKVMVKKRASLKGNKKNKKQFRGRVTKRKGNKK